MHILQSPKAVRAAAGAVLAVLAALAFAPPLAAQPAPPGARQVTASPEGFSIAQLKYGGGGDWYADETSISALLEALKARTAVKVARAERVVVSAGDEQLFNYPFLYIVG